MNVQIRKVGLDEIDTITDVTKEAYTHPYDEKEKRISGFKENPELFEAVKSGKMHILVATIGDKIVGAIRYAFHQDDSSAYFSRLVVLKEYRGQGVASRLVNRVEVEAKGQGAIKIKLDFMQEKNLQSFYERLGYEITEVREHGNHHDVFAEKNI